MNSIQDRLEYLRGEIRAERISYGEIAELQGLAPHIDADDTELLEWAGVPDDSVTCDRHGGPWGSDHTCERCTFENGRIRPVDQPGSLGPGQQ